MLHNIGCSHLLFLSSVANMADKTKPMFKARAVKVGGRMSMIVKEVVHVLTQNAFGSTVPS